jgi:hypothetical protein
MGVRLCVCLSVYVRVCVCACVCAPCQVLRTLRIADVRLEGVLLARVAFAAMPVLSQLRSAEPLSGQELWLVLRLIVRSLEAMAQAGAAAEARATAAPGLSSPGCVVAPHPLAALHPPPTPCPHAPPA